MSGVGQQVGRSFWVATHLQGGRQARGDSPRAAPQVLLPHAAQATALALGLLMCEGKDMMVSRYDDIWHAPNQ